MKKHLKPAAAILSAAISLSALSAPAYADDSFTFFFTFPSGSSDIYYDNQETEAVFFEDPITVDQFSKNYKPSLEGSSSSEGIFLSWNYAIGADYFSVYKYDPSQKKFLFVQRVYGTYFVDTDVESRSEYNYKISAHTESGEMSKISDTCRVKTGIIIGRPDIATRNDTITVSWKTTKSAEGYEIYYYKRKAAPNSFYVSYSGSDTVTHKGDFSWNAADQKFTKLYTTEKDSVTIKRDKAYDYYFKVRAYYTENGKKKYSGFSDILDSTSSPALMNGALGASKNTYSVISYRSDLNGWTQKISDADKKILDDFIAKNFTSDMTPFEKAQYAARYIHDNVDYASASQLNAISNISPVNAVFVKKTGQCYQYNSALASLLAYMGYDIRLCNGYRGYDSSDRWPHTWCEITLDGIRYVVDAGNKKDGLYNFCIPYGNTQKYLLDQ